MMFLHNRSITIFFLLYLIIVITIIFVNGEDNTSVKSSQTIARWLVRHIGWGTISTSVVSMKGSGKIAYFLCIVTSNHPSLVFILCP